MHYYQKNIGDYRRDTMHLSPLEHGVYNLFMDTYYLSEAPLCPNHAELMRTHCVRSADEVRAAENVLKDFFDLTEVGYIHKRCDIEIEAFHSKSRSATESAKVRWERVRCERIANAIPTQSEGNANHKPLTINHKPITNKTKSKDLSTPAVQTDSKKGTQLPDDWVLPKMWGDWALFEKPHWTAVDVRRVADDFRDHWLSNANQAKSKKADWLATWRKWVRNPLNEKNPHRTNSVQDARLDTARQIFGGTDGTQRKIIDITPRQAIEGSGENFPEAIPCIRESDAG